MTKQTDTTDTDTAYALTVLLAAVAGWRYESVAIGALVVITLSGAIYGHSKGFWQWMLPYLKELQTAVFGLFVRDEPVEIDAPYQFSPGQEIGNGQFIVTDLPEVGSFGVYAITRAGKSTFVKSFLYQLITKNSPSKLQLVISDLKDGLDFAKFRYLKHLALPVAETTAESERQINWLLKEKQRRSELFKAAPRFDVPSNLNEYHEVNIGLGLPRLPLILAIFDEFQNVTMENEAALNGLVKIKKLLNLLIPVF